MLTIINQAVELQLINSSLCCIVSQVHLGCQQKQTCKRCSAIQAMLGLT